MYAEGVLVTLGAPLLVLLFFAGAGLRRVLMFMVIGMVVCLLSAYMNSFLAGLAGVDDMDAAIVVAPMVEEIAKYLPLVFYFLVFEPRREGIVDAALALGCGFAIFENACYLSEFGLDQVLLMALRGLSAGAMHAGCTAFVGLALAFSRDERWPRFTAMAGVLVIAIIYHGIYNLLVSFPGPMRLIGYALPLTFALLLALGNVRNTRVTAR